MQASDSNSMLDAAKRLSVAELSRFLGLLEEIRCIAQLRMIQTAQPAPASDHDELLTIDEASRRLGLPKDHLYRTEYAFTRRIGRRHRFSAKGIEEFISQQAILPASHQKAYTPPTSAIQRKRARKGGEDEKQNRSGVGESHAPIEIRAVGSGPTPRN
jgi:hypothetical protein